MARTEGAKGAPIVDAAARRRRATTIADEAEEGVLLSEYACRMALKNRIIVNALRAGADFDPDAVAQAAREVLDGLAHEAEQSAIRMIDERGVAEVLNGRGRHQHDYRATDTGNLDRRERVYRAVARLLRQRMTEPNELARLVESARADAWHDVSGAIDAALDRRAQLGQLVVGDELERQEGVRMLITEDLPALAAAHEPAPESSLALSTRSLWARIRHPMH